MLTVLHRQCHTAKNGPTVEKTRFGETVLKPECACFTQRTSDVDLWARVSGSVGLKCAHEFAFLTVSQVMAMLLCRDPTHRESVLWGDQGAHTSVV